ncbi:MAG: TonB-dependent receptor [Bacteroidales bacterium]|nr:TonB-dependent receptor [Bacteroidales bacterium]
MKHIYFTLLLCLLCYICKAQNISGVVYNQNSEPIPFANIILLNQDSSFVRGTISDIDGIFTIKNSEDAKYIKISSIGYLEKIEVNNKDKYTIILLADIHELSEVNVSADLPQTRIKDGGLVIEIENSVLSKVGTTQRLLGKLPGVRKTQDGFEVFGKGTPEIYINGIKVLDNTEIERISPNNIKNISVITNPGVQYGADVYSVILITTKKPEGEGFGINAQSELNRGINLDQNHKIDLNYRHKKLDVFSSFYFFDNNEENKFESSVVNNSNYNWLHIQNDTSNYEASKIQLTFGLNYQINNKHSLGVKYLSDVYCKDDDKIINHEDVYKNSEKYDFLFSDNNNKYLNSNYHLVNIYYRGVFKKLKINFNTDYVKKSNNIEFNNFDSSLNYESRRILNYNNFNTDMIASKLVLNHSLWKGEFFLGTEDIFTKRNDDYLSCNTSIIPTINSTEKQYSLSYFTQYKHPLLNNWGIDVGFRYEYTNYKYYDFEKIDKSTSKVYNNYFPSIKLSANFDKCQMLISYIEKTKRPTYSNLSSMINYINRYYYEVGNSKLKPSKIKELSFIFSYDFLELETAYKDVDDYINYLTKVDTENPEITIWKPENEKMKYFKILFSASPEFGCYNPSFVFHLSRQNYSLMSDNKLIDLNKPFYMITLNNNFSLNHDFSIDLDFEYNSKGHNDTEYYNKDYIVTSIYFSKSFCKNAFYVELGVFDIFDKTINSFISYSQTGYSDYIRKYDDRELTLTFRYIFNAKKSVYQGTGAGQDEKDRF